MAKESQHIEWKESWHDKYLKWICGFANADGGTLIIVENDSGKVIGIPNANKLMEDKIVIWNAGQLPDELSIRQLQKKHPSIPYNPLVANAFFRSGNIEAWGRGIEKINEECDKIDAPHPEFNHEFSGLMITFKGRQVNKQVTTEVKRLLKVCKGEQSKLELKALLALKNDEHFRTYYLKPAVENEFIVMTQPDSPKSPTPKYILTPKGQQILENI